MEIVSLVDTVFESMNISTTLFICETRQNKQSFIDMFKVKDYPIVDHLSRDVTQSNRMQIICEKDMHIYDETDLLSSAEVIFIFSYTSFQRIADRLTSLLGRKPLIIFYSK